jgi:hypothetical protein
MQPTGAPAVLFSEGRRGCRCEVCVWLQETCGNKLRIGACSGAGRHAAGGASGLALKQHVRPLPCSSLQRGHAGQYRRVSSRD